MDGTLTVPPATTPAMGVAGAAYTNNDLDPNTATTLFDLDTAADQVVGPVPGQRRRARPDRQAAGRRRPGRRLRHLQPPRLGATQGNHGFATISVLGRSSFYQVSLLTGRASRIGSFRPSTQVADIAIPLDQG